MLGNPYFIGFLLLATEIVINLSFGSTVVSSIALGFAAGALFVWRNQKEMVFSDKMKVLAVYLIAVFGISLISVSSEGIESFIVFVILFFVALYGIFTYVTMSLGSSMTYKAIRKEKEENSDSVPPSQ